MCLRGRRIRRGEGLGDLLVGLKKGNGLVID